MLSGCLALAFVGDICGWLAGLVPADDADTDPVSCIYKGDAAIKPLSVVISRVPRVGANPKSLNSLDHTSIESVSTAPVNVAEALVCERLTI